MSRPICRTNRKRRSDESLRFRRPWAQCSTAWPIRFFIIRLSSVWSVLSTCLSSSHPRRRSPIRGSAHARSLNLSDAFTLVASDRENFSITRTLRLREAFSTFKLLSLFQLGQFQPYCHFKLSHPFPVCFRQYSVLGARRDSPARSTSPTLRSLRLCSCTIWNIDGEN